MLSVTNCGFCWLVLAMAVLFVPMLMAQEPPEIPAAPVPTPILLGKKAFISNGESTAVTGIPNLTYNKFYALMKDWGRYELVSTPADADVVFEIRFNEQLGPVRVSQGSGGSPAEPEFRLLILDPKTHVVLWAFIEHVKEAILVATARKNYDQAMNALAEDVKKLVAPPTAPGDASKK